MSGEALRAFSIGLLSLAAMRSLLRISMEGWIKPLLALGSAMGAFSFVRWNLSPFLPFVIGLVALFLPTRPSHHACLSKRARKVVAYLVSGLGVDIHTEVIQLEQIKHNLRSEGLDESKAHQIINACAGILDGKTLILITPGAAALPDNELSFITAHEIGHHVLGHTRESLFDKIDKALSSKFGQAMTWGLSTIWKNLIVPRRSQSQKFDADKWAIQRLKKLGMDTKGGTIVLECFSEEEDTFFAHISTKLFGSHPPAVERSARIKKLIDA